MLGAAARPVAATVSDAFGSLDVSQMLLAATPMEPVVTDPNPIPDFRNMEFMSNADGASALGPDLFFYIYVVISLIIVVVSLYILSKPYWENRWLVEKINAQKLKFITDESSTTPVDRYELGRMYNKLRDYPAALAEFDEVEEDWYTMRGQLDPEDTMGALASRAMLHNSKGYGLSNLEPARVSAARREFVRAITFWPEYPEALQNIGQELLKRKRFDVALRTFNTALKWQPADETLQDLQRSAQRGLDEIEMMEQDGFVR